MTSLDREARDQERYLKKGARAPKNNPNSPSNKNSIYAQINNNYYNESDYQHSVYKEISYMNGLINRMDLNSIKHKCTQEGLDPRGKTVAVKKRLKEYYKNQKLEQVGLLQNKNVDYFVVVDFEATCEAKNPPGYPHEIIEFPAVLISSRTKEIVDEFHSYIRPLINPTLSEFCRTLTGIDQEIVDKSESFLMVHDRFLNWLKSHDLGRNHSYCFVTDGPFDFGRFLFLQTSHSRVDYPSYGTTWVNLRKAFANFYRHGYHTSNASRLPGLQSMLAFLGMKFEGSPHSGIDDARNIAKILIRMLRDRAYIRINEKIVLQSADGKSIHDPTPNHPGRLQSVVPVTKPEADKFFKYQMKIIENHNTTCTTSSNQEDDENDESCHNN